MILKYICILSIIFLVFSCKSSKSKYTLKTKTKTELTVIIDSMYKLDQKIRRYYSFELDSIYGIKRDMRLKLKEILKEKYTSYKIKKDSARNLMHKIDNTNTLKLLKITKKHGFPSNERLNTYKAKAYMIFVHSNLNKYGEVIRNTINIEYKYNRINEYKKGYIFWHLDGRKGWPPMCGENGEAIWQ